MLLSPFSPRRSRGARFLASCCGLLVAALLSLPSLAFADEDVEGFDDLMGGFDDDFDASELDEMDAETPAWIAALPFGEEIAERVDLSGSIATGAVFSYLGNRVPHGDEENRFSEYGNLTRLDLDGFLQLDIELPGDWQVRAEALGWYDFVYRIKGRSDFGGEVLDVYEWQVDSGEVYIAGPIHDKVDLTIGRKIVNWGRSDTFRVVDVVNPLDNKEPGLVDIEDLRRPKAMVKLDAQTGPWSAQFLVIPEARFDRQPPLGSDFFPDPTTFGVTPRDLSAFQIDGRSDFGDVPSFAGKVDGRFSGWDFSIYGAYTDQGSRVLDARPAPAPLTPASPVPRFEANRFSLLGAAGNITRGAWLVKAELAWLGDLRVLNGRRSTPANLIPLTSERKDRMDTMIGVEYYGPDQLTIALEIVNRHLLDDPGQRGVDRLTEQSTFETGIRISRPFLRERLDVTVLAIILGERAQDGVIFRASGDYEITDALKMEGGILIFSGGPDRALGAFDKNDRLYAELKYSF
ncbi:MAG: DUF1302 family protein [Myxococcota bacterium]